MNVSNVLSFKLAISVRQFIPLARTFSFSSKLIAEKTCSINHGNSSSIWSCFNRKTEMIQSNAARRFETGRFAPRNGQVTFNRRSAVSRGIASFVDSRRRSFTWDERSFTSCFFFVCRSCSVVSPGFWIQSIKPTRFDISQEKNLLYCWARRPVI